MNEQLIKALLKVLGDGQSYLYARTMQKDSEALGKTVTDEQFEQWEDDWKKESAELVRMILEDDES